ncbi:MAG: hypothetical protein E7049_03135 [Lentisphaerae bacterium]|nr:hypothetical protein [Lentisphaerota bacterium]
MKKVFFLAFSALFAVRFALAASATVGGVTYNYVVSSYWYDEETEEEYNGQFAVITGAKGAKGKLSIPKKLGKYPVLKIGDYAFEENNAITSVVIPAGVREIGSYAFEECGKLTSVSLPEGLAIIGYDAFCGCRKLGDITIPSTLHPAYGYDGVAFCFCYGMKSIAVADGNAYYKSVGGVAYSADGSTLVSYPAGRTGAFEIPEDVTSVSGEAFAGARVSSVFVHSGVEWIGDGAFLECHSLTNITVDPDNEYYKDVNGALFSKDGTRFISYPAGKSTATIYTLPQSVTQIGDDAFAGCKFKGIILPSTLSELSYEAFEGCEKLTQVILGTGLSTINDQSFYYVPKLSTVTLPQSVEYIESCAFEECGMKTSTIYYPRSAGRHRHAFEDCPAKKIAYSSACTVAFDLNYDGAGDYLYDRNVVAKQPVGILPTPRRQGYGFAGWWTAPNGGTKISSATKISRDTTFYARWARAVAITKKGSGTVAGGGNKTVGSKVTLAAKPAKNWTFVGWEAWWDIDEGGDYSKGAFSRKPTFSFTMPDDAVDALAYFVRKPEDYAPIIDAEYSTWYVADGQDDYIYIDSLSYSTLKASNLPKGISLKGESYVKDGDNVFALVKTGATKPGVYSVKLTATNRSGKSSTKTIKVVTPNIVDEGIITIDAAKRYEVSAGFTFDASAWEELGISALGGWKITAASGIAGLSWKNGRLAGVPTAPGVHCVTFTLTKGKQTKTATATFFVNPLPSGVSGTYYGHTGVPDTEGEWDEEKEEYVYADPPMGRKSKRITLTIGSGGKISAKVGSLSLTGTGVSYSEYDGTYYVRAQLRKKSGKTTYDYILDGAVDPSTGSFDGSYYEFSCSGSTCISGWRNADCGAVARKRLTDPDALATARGAGKRGMIVRKSGSTYWLDCPECIAGPEKFTKTLFAKADEKGLVTLSGKIDGKAVSGTAYLLPTDGDDGLYVAYFFTGGFVVEINYWLDGYGEYQNVYGTAWKQ